MNAEFLKEVNELYKAGKTEQEIVHEFGLSSALELRGLCYIAHKGKEIVAEEIRQVKRFKDNGATMNEIADILHMNRYKVRALSNATTFALMGGSKPWQNLMALI